jgi:hypothetical protein
MVVLGCGGVVLSELASEAVESTCSIFTVCLCEPSNTRYQDIEKKS